VADCGFDVGEKEEPVRKRGKKNKTNGRDHFGVPARREKKKRERQEPIYYREEGKKKKREK